MSLEINGTDIIKISGPVSTYLLKPNEGYLKKFPYAPILILFGDSHNSTKKYCDDADMKIYDDKFLQLLSNAVSEKGFID